MPPKGKSAANGKKGKGKAYTRATVNAEGFTVTDIFKKKWLVGKPVGVGGFGCLYQAKDVSGGTGADYVIKIEPKSNGPLFSELSFYQRKAKQDIVTAWMSEQKMKKLGMPMYISSGIHTHDNEEYRFMVIPRFGEDLQKLFVESGKSFPVKTVLVVCLQVLDVLEYLHDNDYVHADIKAANLLLGFKQAESNQIYLLDYGLAFKYRSDGKVTEYKPDPRRAHDGTIEFTSRDAHDGCSPSRRGDLEILGYCMLQWLTSELPWEKCLTDPAKVQSQKESFMANVKSSISKLGQDIPDCITKYMGYVSKLEYADTPDYNKLRRFIRDFMKKEKISDDNKLNFTNTSKSVKRKSAGGEPAPKRKAKSKAEEAGPSVGNTNNSAGTPAKRTPAKRTPAKKTPAKSTPAKKAPKSSAVMKKTSPNAQTMAAKRLAAAEISSKASPAKTTLKRATKSSRK